MVINNRKYFAFSLYTQDKDNVTSYCGHTFFGWSHETGVNPGDWSCYIGAKVDDNGAKAKTSKSLIESTLHEVKLYKTNYNFIDEINKKQNSWQAAAYEFLEGMKISDLIKMVKFNFNLIFNYCE